jgi:strictosidine synthase-like protein
MPYALVATDGRLYAGLSDGRLWESTDRGDTWTALQLRGDKLDTLVALDHATRWDTNSP